MFEIQIWIRFCILTMHCNIIFIISKLFKNIIRGDLKLLRIIL